MEFREIYGVKVSKCGVVIGKRGKLLKQCDNGKGYLIVTVVTDGKRTSKAVHRLVAEAWIENPDNLPEVNHKDNNRRNNSIDNLEWCTHSYNIKYSYDTNGRIVAGEKNANCKSTEADAIEICKLLQEGLASAQIRDKGFSYSLVRNIKRRQTWTHISKDYSW